MQRRQQQQQSMDSTHSTAPYQEEPQLQKEEEVLLDREKEMWKRAENIRDASSVVYKYMYGISYTNVAAILLRSQTVNMRFDQKKCTSKIAHGLLICV